LTGQKPKPTVIWRLNDGRSGHDAQSNGLIKSLSLSMPCDCYDIEVSAFKQKLVNLLRSKFPPGVKLSDPDLIIGAGHQTHIPILCAQYARGGKTIVIMKPSLPYSWFDYCIIPEHDNPPQRNNIITTQGAINSITSTNNHDAGQGLMLIGGPSKHHSWNLDNLIYQLKEIIKHDQTVHWTITDSPRTPTGTLESLAEQCWQTVKLLPHKQCSTSRLHDLYATCGIVWVSEDSVSMVYEALTSGASVGLLSVPRKGTSRVGNAIDGLSSNNKVTLYQNWRETKMIHAPLKNFNESARCADLLYQRDLCE
jgi:mitochondrial fission protein ELM1